MLKRESDGSITHVASIDPAWPVRDYKIKPRKEYELDNMIYGIQKKNEKKKKAASGN